MADEELTWPIQFKNKLKHRRVRIQACKIKPKMERREKINSPVMSEDSDEIESIHTPSA